MNYSLNSKGPVDKCSSAAASTSAMRMMSSTFVAHRAEHDQRAFQWEGIHQSRRSGRLWRHDVHAGTPALNGLRMIVSLAGTRYGRHRLRTMVFYDIVAAFVHASVDEVVGVVHQEGLLERGECFLLLKALCGTRMASKRWQRHYMIVLRTHGWSASKVIPGPAGTCGCHGDDFMAEGSDALLGRLGRVMKDEFDTKMLGRVGRGYFAGVKFLKRTLRWHEQAMCLSWSGGTRHVTEVAVLLGLTDSSCDENTNSGKGNWRRRSRCPRAAEYLPPSLPSPLLPSCNLPLSGGVDWMQCRPGSQPAGKAVRSAAREPAKLDWMRKLPLAKFLVSHSELEWLCQAQDVPEKYVLYGDSDSAGSESRRSTTGAFEQLGQYPHRIQLLNSTSSLSQAERQSCMQRDLR